MKHFPLFIIAAGLLISCENTEAPSPPSNIKANIASHPKSYSGDASAIQATILHVTTTVGHSGPLPANGGSSSNSVATVNIPGVVTASFLNTSVSGQGTNSVSKASTANLLLTLGGNTISATLLPSIAEASCGTGHLTTGGSAQILVLVINGQKIVVTGSPNQTIFLPNGRVVINEQTHPANGLTVTALHLYVNNIGDVAVSKSHADIVC